MAAPRVSGWAGSAGAGACACSFPAKTKIRMRLTHPACIFRIMPFPFALPKNTNRLVAQPLLAVLWSCSVLCPPRELMMPAAKHFPEQFLHTFTCGAQCDPAQGRELIDAPRGSAVALHVRP